MRILIIGCGYVGSHVGPRLAAAGHDVVAMQRSGSVGQPLANRGVQFIKGDITRPSDLAGIEPNYDAVINLVSSSKGGANDYREVYLEGTRNVLAWLRRHPPSKYIYTSSTSVYAQTDGSWVTEKSLAEPDSATSRILIETEKQLQQAHASAGFPAIILRVSGIYGPERGHLFKQFLRGEATLRDDGSSYINNIHLEDVSGTLLHLLNEGTTGEIYNVADDEPVAHRDFFAWLATVLRKPMPPSAPGDPTRKRGLTNKRVSNAKLCASGYSFVYPTFREGYSAEIRALSLQ